MNDNVHPAFKPFLDTLSSKTHSMQFPVSIAYNMQDKKIGCPLMQAALGATISGGDVTLIFETSEWELSPQNLALFEIRSQEEFDLMIEITKDKTGLYRRSNRDQLEL